MKNRPNFSREIGKALTEHPANVPDRITEISEQIEQRTEKSESTVNRKAGRPKKSKGEHRKQIILTIGPDTYTTLSSIPDFRRRLSHYIDENLDNVQTMLEDYVIK